MDKTLKSYLDCFDDELSKVVCTPEQSVLPLIIDSYKEFWRELQVEDYTTLACFFKMLERHLQIASSIAHLENVGSKASTSAPLKSKNKSDGKRKENKKEYEAFKKQWRDESRRTLALLPQFSDNVKPLSKALLS